MTKKEVKQENSEIESVGLSAGVYETLELIPNQSKREADFEARVNALKEGKFVVLKAGTPQNSLYPMIAKLKKAGLDVVWSKVKTPDGIAQFALYVKKD